MAARETPRKGHYLGTVVEGKWWKRYRKEGLFARGTGEWWIEAGCLFFRRYLTRGPIVIALARLASVETGSWHAGQWGGGRRVLKLAWEHEGRHLTAGFTLTRTAAEAAELAEQIKATSGLNVRRSGY